MKISCIICSYNQGPFLEDAICSVLNQTYSDKELIIIDGGSQDESPDIIKRYENEIKYWVSEPDRGQTHAINKGIEQAEGQIVGWLNSDDIYLPKCFEKVVAAFNHKSQPNVVHGNRILMNREGQNDGWSSPGPFEPETTYYNICSETAFWRRRINEDGERLKESLHFAMDLEWFTRLFVQYGRFRYINDFLGAFRCYDESKSSTLLDIRDEEGPDEWKRLLGLEKAPNQRFNWEFYGSLVNVGRTVYPMVMKKIFKNPVSLVSRLPRQ